MRSSHPIPTARAINQKQARPDAYGSDRSRDSLACLQEKLRAMVAGAARIARGFKVRSDTGDRFWPIAARRDAVAAGRRV